MGLKRKQIIFVHEIPVCFLGLKISPNLNRSRREVVFIPNQKELDFQYPALQLALQTHASPAELQWGTQRSLPSTKEQNHLQCSFFFSKAFQTSSTTQQNVLY